jgi:hypothetical protein
MAAAGRGDLMGPVSIPNDAALDGKTFVGVSNSADGDVGSGTRFTYRQDGDAVWADYAGGDVVRGYLIGTRAHDQLDFRYVHLNASGRTAGGHCRSRISVLPDGRVRMYETWTWESRPGSGESVVEEVAGGW